MSDSQEKFDCWAVVEVMGHSRYAGRVTEQAIGGCAFVRVDVPAVADRLPFTKLLSQGSIFAIMPCSEEAARKIASRIVDRPITIYQPSVQHELTHEESEDDDDY
jgi:hypothetical protein